MHQTTSNSDSISICVLENDPSALRKTSEVLSSAGWRVETFIDRDAILDYAAMYQRAAAIINFGGSRRRQLGGCRRNFPFDSSDYLLKVRRDKARKMLIGSELVNMIKQRCVETLEKPAFQRPTFSKKKESNLGYCD
jgi:hypothetical protein